MELFVPSNSELSKSKISKKASKRKHLDEELSDDDVGGEDDDDEAVDMDDELSDEEVDFDDDEGSFMSQFKPADDDDDESGEDFDEENIAFSDNGKWSEMWHFWNVSVY